MSAGCEQLLDSPQRAAPVRARLAERIATFAVPLAVYAATVIPIALVHRDKLNIDAICYIRRALYLVQGDFYHAISGYWSPMISWCIAPFLAMGMDGLHAAHLVVCLWGAALIVAFGIFLRTFTSFPRWLRVAAMVALALFLRTEAVREVTPDIILGAWLMVYLSAVMSRQLLDRRGMQLLAGVLGGMAYLGKAYAFPFVLVHMPMTFAIRGWVRWREQRRREGGGDARRTSAKGGSSDDIEAALAGKLPVAHTPPHARGIVWQTASGMLVALVGFAIVAGPWVGVLSWRYGGFTFSTAGARAHAVVGPRKGHPSTSELPPDPYILEFENPESMPYRFWSPFDSREMYRHQIKVISENLGEMIHSIRDFDDLGLGWIAILAGAAALLPIVQRPGQRWKTLWLLMTIVIYCVGFLPVFFIPRYINPLILPLSLTLGLCLVTFWGSESGKGRNAANAVRIALACIIIFSYSYSAARERISSGRGPDIQPLARALMDDGVRGPIASSNRRYGRQIAFEMGQKFVNLPTREKNVAVLDRKLKGYGVGAILIWSDPEIEEEAREAQITGRRDAKLVELPGWRRLPESEYPELEVYVRVEGGK